MEMENIKKQLKELEETRKITQDQLDETKASFENTKLEYERIEKELEEIEQKIDAAKEEATSARVEKQQMKGQAAVLKEQVRSAQANAKHYAERLQNIERDLTERQQEKETVLEEKQEQDLALAQAEKVQTDAEQKVSDIQQRIADSQTNMENSKNEIISLLNQRSSIKGKLQRYDAMTEQINIRMSELNQKLIQIRSDEMGQEELLEQCKKELQEVSEELKAKLSERAEIEQKIQELQTFIARFSANKSKSRQATSRRKLLEKISVEDMPASSRRYPWVGFKAEREPGKDRLFVTDISKTVDGEKLLNHVSFIVGKEDKIAILGKNELAVTMLFKILMGDEEPDEGTVKWGVSTTQAYFPKDHNSYFENCDYDLIDWMRQFSTDKRESYLRTFLGRMLFSGDDVYKQVKVLSGGEKVRCMISKMMLSGANFLVFDQPTNHLDLESIAALNNGMAAFPYNIIFTSHDHQLTQTVANRIIEITPDGIIDRRCTYDEYMHIAGQEAE